MLEKDFINQVVNGYKILRILGRGAFSTVYQVHDKKTNQNRALKMLNKAPGCDFAAKNEIKHLMSIKDHHIVHLHDFFLHATHVCLIMDALSCNLLDVKARYKAGLPENIMHRLIKDTLEGTMCLHNQSIIHTDIKPENILVENDRTPSKINFKLCDLGSACRKDRRHSGEIQTLNYRSPEIILHDKSYTEKIDIWSLACVYYEVLTGLYLFEPQKGDRCTLAEDHLNRIATLLGNPVQRGDNLTALLLGKTTYVVLLAAMLNPDHKERPSAAICQEKLNTVYVPLINIG